MSRRASTTSPTSRLTDRLTKVREFERWIATEGPGLDATSTPSG